MPPLLDACDLAAAFAAPPMREEFARRLQPALEACHQDPLALDQEAPLGVRRLGARRGIAPPSARAEGTPGAPLPSAEGASLSAPLAEAPEAPDA